MNVINEYLECNCKSIVSYWTYCHDLAIDALRWAAVQYRDNDFRMLIIESAEANSIFPAINLDKYMPEGIEDDHFGWAFHVVLFDGKQVHDGWFDKQLGLKQYLQEMFPGEKSFFLTCGSVQQVVNVNDEDNIVMNEVNAAC